MGNRTYRHLLKKLEDAGFIKVSQRGSHAKLKRDSCILIIPNHGNKDLGFGLIKKIEKQSGVKLI